MKTKIIYQNENLEPTGERIVDLSEIIIEPLFQSSDASGFKNYEYDLMLMPLERDTDEWNYMWNEFKRYN